jgi:predicted nucleotidyltransferase
MISMEVVNLSFEVRLSNLVSLLHKITNVLEQHHLSYEVVGGMAVIVYVEESSLETTPLTRDVDVMINRADFPQIIEAAEEQGFRYRHAMGVDMLLPGNATKAVQAVHLVFSGEKTNPKQLLPNPPIRPTSKEVEGGQVKMITFEDLLSMKLSAHRLKDQVHVKAFDAAGLIDRDIEERLSEPLAQRLRYVREQD